MLLLMGLLLINYNGVRRAPKLLLPLGNQGPTQHVVMVPWADSTPQTNRHLNWFSHFCTAHAWVQQTDSETDRHTDHSTSTAIGRILCFAQRCGITTETTGSIILWIMLSAIQITVQSAIKYFKNQSSMASDLSITAFSKKLEEFEILWSRSWLARINKIFWQFKCF